jgi:hypothetical protein
VRPVEDHHAWLEPVRARRLRLRISALPLVLGRETAADHDPGGTVTGFSLANPKLAGERDQTRQTLSTQPANRPAPGTTVVTDKGLSGADIEQFFTGLDLTLVRPAHRDEKTPRPFPNWLRQRIEAIIWTLKNQLGLEHHNARVPAGLWTRVLQRLLAPNAVIWHILDHQRTSQTLTDRLRPLTHHQHTISGQRSRVCTLTVRSSPCRRFGCCSSFGV